VAIRGTEPSCGYGSPRMLHGGPGPRAFIAVGAQDPRYLHHRSLCGEGINVPVHLLILAEMPADAARQAVQCAPEVEIEARGERKGSQLPHGEELCFCKVKHEDVAPFGPRKVACTHGRFFSHIRSSGLGLGTFFADSIAVRFNDNATSWGLLNKSARPELVEG